MAYTSFIKTNVAPYAASQIGVYNSNGERVGSIPLGDFKPAYGERLYRFGVISDVHNETNQADENQSDLRNALNFFNQREDIEFTCITGDLTQTSYSSGNLATEMALYQANLAAISNSTPVYPTTGNHDCPQSSDIDIDTFKRYAGISDLFTSDAVYSYEVTKTHQTSAGTDVTDHFLFLGMKRYEFTSSTYLDADITWLGNKLEAYKNDRCFVFTHMFFPDAAGNFREIYPSGNWLSGTQLANLKTLRNNYPRSIWFSGHSHWKWYLQAGEADANIWPTSNVGRTTAWTVHLPSCASPIDSSVCNPELSSTRVSMPGQSEGAIIDVYEDYIDIRAIEFKGANDPDYVTRYLPISQYRLYTAPEAGSSSTEPNRVFVTADMIRQHPKKVANGEVAFTVNDNHDLTVTFSAISQGILINGGNLVGGDNVRVYFDSVTYNPEQSDTAKTYIGLYDGSNYTNTSGMTPHISSTSNEIGIQINSSSRFETNGGVLPCTITFTNFRYEKL